MASQINGFDLDLMNLVDDKITDFEMLYTDVSIHDADLLSNIFYKENSNSQNSCLSDSYDDSMAIPNNADNSNISNIITTNNIDIVVNKEKILDLNNSMDSSSAYVEFRSDINEASYFIFKKDPLVGALVRLPLSTSPTQMDHQFDETNLKNGAQLTLLPFPDVEDVTESFNDLSTKTKLQRTILNRCRAEGKDIQSILNESPKIETTMPSLSELEKEIDRKERNRQSAKKSRESKKAEYNELKKKYAELSHTNEAKKKNVKALAHTARVLEEFINTHNLHPHINQENADETFIDTGQPMYKCIDSTRTSPFHNSQPVNALKTLEAEGSLNIQPMGDISLNPQHENDGEFQEKLEHFLIQYIQSAEQSNSFSLQDQHLEGIEIHQDENSLPLEQIDVINLSSKQAHLDSQSSPQLALSTSYVLQEIPDTQFDQQLAVTNLSSIQNLSATQHHVATNPVKTIPNYQLDNTQHLALTDLCPAENFPDNHQFAVTKSYPLQTIPNTQQNQHFAVKDFYNNQTIHDSQRIENGTLSKDYYSAAQLKISGSPHYDTGCFEASSLHYQTIGTNFLPTSVESLEEPVKNSNSFVNQNFTNRDNQLQSSSHVIANKAGIPKQVSSFNSKNIPSVWLVENSGSDDELKDLTLSFIDEPTVKKRKVDCL